MSSPACWPASWPRLLPLTAAAAAAACAASVPALLPAAGVVPVADGRGDAMAQRWRHVFVMER